MKRKEVNFSEGLALIRNSLTKDNTMNEFIAEKRALELLDKQIDKWKIGKCLGSGKTAFVCEAYQNDTKYAIKIFMTEFLSEQEIEDLKLRLNRQLEIVGKDHTNLVKIYHSGQCPVTNCFFLVMEYIDAPTLNKVIDILPREKIKPLISQIASAAEFLEGLGLVHRDIKPENILISPDFSKAVLLDLGVIRPLEKDNLTDTSNSLNFIGTLRYSSPEFLLRKEEHNINGWRALTFYQIGAVLHDMIMKYPIFEGYTEPYARLVHAIDSVTPQIYADDVDPDVIYLAKLCLIKQAQLRLQFVNWKKFDFSSNSGDYLNSAKDRIQVRLESKQIQSENYIKPKNERYRANEQILFDLRNTIDFIIRDICVGESHFPRLSVNSKEVNNSQLITTIIFDESEIHSLIKSLNIVIVSNFLDNESKLIQMQCVGYINEIPQKYEPNTLSIFYEGFLEEDSIHNKMDEMIHLMLDQAQSQCDYDMYDNAIKYDIIIYRLKEVQEDGIK